MIDTYLPYSGIETDLLKVPSTVLHDPQGLFLSDHWALATDDHAHWSMDV